MDKDNVSVQCPLYLCHLSSFIRLKRWWNDTVRSNQNGWKAILWSKIRLLWHGIDHLKSAAIPSFKILCCRKFVDLSNEVLYILVSQLADKLPDVKVWGLKKNLVWVHSNTDLLGKSVFECARKRLFIKSQTLTSGNLSAPLDTNESKTNRSFAPVWSKMSTF